MAKFEFPKNPGTDRKSPFVDERGGNPFSDGIAAPAEAITENAFAPPADASGRSHTPGDYEATMVPHAKRALGLAITGLLLSGVGVLGAGLSMLGSAVWITPLFIFLPVQFAALALAMPACIMARRDLVAMKAGAMPDDYFGKARLAWWLGIIGLLLGAIPVVGYFGLLIADALS